MVKLPKATMRFCPKCKKHTEHKIALNKAKKASSLKYGSKYRAKLRGKARGFGNLGRYSKPAVTKFKMTGKKQSKKTDIRYKCSVCGKSQVRQSSFRAKKVEFQ